jgi:hypothetical protein
VVPNRSKKKAVQEEMDKEVEEQLSEAEEAAMHSALG